MKLRLLYKTYYIALKDNKITDTIEIIDCDTQTDRQNPYSHLEGKFGIKPKKRSSPIEF